MAVTAVAASAVATVVESGGDTAVMQERWQLLKFETLKCEPDGQGVHVLDLRLGVECRHAVIRFRVEAGIVPNSRNSLFWRFLEGYAKLQKAQNQSTRGLATWGMSPSSLLFGGYNSPSATRTRVVAPYRPNS